jgi:hypothetical protein
LNEGNGLCVSTDLVTTDMKPFYEIL